ncbi:MAG: hypothetical protein ACI3ZL_07575 [Candidatus Cryptobacteroides sp.]
MRYTDITDIKSLDAAREQLSGRMEAKAKEISRHYEAVKESCTPVSIFAGVVKRVSYRTPYDRILLGIVRNIIHRLKA